ncbi:MULTISPECIES: PBP1A family penicillin-binding protein [unclassified Pseudovibrio]|uniref:transglycosylase domain-containing protein n=1 Tax=unclassified Pseudovibrio TaxID=2627060 RepID=UPI001FCCA30C|nr:MULTISPECIES: PBP1A family penicillin-binding protein [unclassified Pseudovibrio]
MATGQNGNGKKRRPVRPGQRPSGRPPQHPEGQRLKRPAQPQRPRLQGVALRPDEVEDYIRRPSKTNAPSKQSSSGQRSSPQNPTAQARKPAPQRARPAQGAPVKKPAKKPSRKARQQTLAALDAATSSGKPKSQSKFRRFLWKSFRFSMYWSVVLGIWGIVVVGGILTYYAAHLPPASEWAVPQRPPNVRIVSANGTLIANRGDTGGEAVRLEQLPTYLPEAVMAIEDRRFRYHFGIDPIGLARAAFVNYTSGRTVQGGSTLTQQLAKNLFLKPERTMQRKMQEVVMALWLEWNYSKDEILEMYLNRVYLGAGAYGVDAASRVYFGKSAHLINLAEAATIAGLLKAPSKYAPTRNAALAEGRAQVVIASMHKAGFITADDAKNALFNPANVVTSHNSSSGNYVADYVMELLPGFVGSIGEDIIVDTTIDWDMQQAAETALTTRIAESRQEFNVTQGAVVTLNRSGAIRALVGGVDYRKSQFNRAVYARRQPGSAFKPFVYLAALERGMTPNTVRRDARVTYRGWTPKNYTKRYYGDVTLTQALAFSINTVAAKLAHEVGPANVARTARRLGITSALKSNPSIALGTSEVTPLEIAAAYVPFSNGGYGVVPHVVRQIRNEHGKVLYRRSGDGTGRVVRGDKLSEINIMMAQTVYGGTGKRALLAGRPAGGKTGTTQGYKDAWFIGYTNSLTTAVWLGNDNNKPMKKVSGGTLPAEIWAWVMETEHQDIPIARLPGVPINLAETSPLLKPGTAPTRRQPTFLAAPQQPQPPRPAVQATTAPRPQNNSSTSPLDLLGRLFGGG